MKRINVIVILLLLVISVLNADNKTSSQDKYNSGLEKFQKGDIDGAIVDLRESVNLDDRNFKAKKSLVDVLLVKGKNLINEEKYDEAQGILKEAYRIFPSNQEVADLYKGLKDGTVQEAKKKEKEQKEKTEKLSSTTEDNKETKDIVTTTIQTQTTKESSVSKSDIAEIEKKYALELEKQRKMYEKIIEKYSKGGNIQIDTSFLKKQTEAFDSFITKYNELLKQNEEDRKKNIEILIEQMKENRKIMEKQAGFSNSITFTIIGSFILAVVIFIGAFYFLFFLARAKKATANYLTNNTITELSNSLYIENDNSNKPQLVYDEQENKDMSLVESEMLKDLLKSEKLKKMHLEMRQGNLSWDTVKEYISEMNKDLRVEILKLVETKLMNEEINNEMVVLPILFPFLTDGDDYIREKAKNLITSNIKKLKTSDTNDIIIQEIEEKGNINIQSLSLKAQEIDKLLYRINHSYNIARYCKGVANILGFSKDKQFLIYETALVHDIGYNFIDKEVLYNMKNKKELSEQDFIEIRKHPLKGKEFLEKFDDVQKEMLEGVLYHHERNDGSGYPEGLKKEGIPIFAKVIGVCDTFEALTSPRFHKEKLTFRSALVIIKDMGKNKFNPEIVDALEEYLTKTNLINIG